MASTDVDNNDLQTYLDTFNKEIEQGDPPIDNDNNATDNEFDDDEGTYFMDTSGNYYYQATKKSLPVESDPPKNIRDSIKLEKKVDVTHKGLNKINISSRFTSVDVGKNDEEDEDEMNYVLVLDNATGKEIDPNDLDPDDPEKEIYEFDENEEEMNKKGSDVHFPKSVIRLKSNTSDRNIVKHQCMHCDYTTTKRCILSRHLRTHSDDRPHKCAVCERGFKSNASLMNHVNTHLGNKPHHCKHCEMSFTTSGELVRHVRYKHTLEKPHKCTECDYASVELSKLKRHMRCHTGERPYQCPHCTYASPDTFKLKRHMRTHTGEKPYECDICHARFTQSNSMKAHRMIHSIGEKPVFQCSLCPTTCGRKTDLRVHIQKLHHSEKPITCKRCSKNFPDRYTYKVHIKTHEGEKCFRCSLCPYASISLRHLESHMLIHTDQKPFVCEMCEMSFRQKQLLRRHMNLYHNKDYVPPKPREKRHTCPDCNRSFSHKGNLMRHMEMHDPDSNIKRFQEKLKLKMGRKTRVSADGSIEIMSSANEMENEEYYEGEREYYDEMEEDYEIIETIDDDELEQKPVLQQSLQSMVDENHTTISEGDPLADIKTVSIKKEADGKEFVAVESADGQQYMVVEVIHCDNEEEDEETVGDDQTLRSANILENNKTDVDNCFGFEECDDDEYLDDSDNKETIQLLEIIDDD